MKFDFGLDMGWEEVIPCILTIVFIPLLFFLFNWCGEILWNYTMPLFHVRTITFWQFAGLATLISFLFGMINFSCRSKN